MSSKRRKLRKMFSNTLQGEVLEKFIDKIMRNEPLFPESHKRAQERVKRIDLAKLKEMAKK